MNPKLESICLIVGWDWDVVTQCMRCGSINIVETGQWGLCFTCDYERVVA